MKKLLSVEFAKTLADETRQKIMRLCSCHELSVSEIVAQLNVAQPTVSHHLALLRDAGLVEIRHDGKQTFYTLNQERVAQCCKGLMTVFAPEAAATKALYGGETAEANVPPTLG